MVEQVASHAPARAQPAPAGWSLLFASWLIAAAATLGTLFQSEVMKLPPCELCWYQRVFMFPLAIMLPLALFPFDARIVRYALPLALAGAAVAFYQLLLTWGVVPESIRPCTQGVPCSETQWVWLGFITVPLIATLAFAAISVLLMLVRRKNP